MRHRAHLRILLLSPPCCIPYRPCPRPSPPRCRFLPAHHHHHPSVRPSLGCPGRPRRWALDVGCRAVPACRLSSARSGTEPWGTRVENEKRTVSVPSRFACFVPVPVLPVRHRRRRRRIRRRTDCIARRFRFLGSRFCFCFCLLPSPLLLNRLQSNPLLVLASSLLLV